MSTPGIAPGILKSFIGLFVDERSHFYRQALGDDGFVHQARELTDYQIEHHLERRCWIAVTRAKATRILAVDLDCKYGPDPVGGMLNRHDRIRKILPEPITFNSTIAGGLHLYWLLQDEVPTVATQALLKAYLGEHGITVGRGACEILPTTTLSLRLPLGAGSRLLHPDRLSANEAADSPVAAIDIISRHLRRHPTDEFLARITERRQLSLPSQSTDKSIRTDTSRPRARQAVERHPGLTNTEVNVIWDATAEMTGLQRYRQMEFLFDLIGTFKATGQRELDLPKQVIVNMGGAHSGTYQDRLAFAEQAGLITCTNSIRPKRSVRRFRLLVPTQGPGRFSKLTDSLADRDLSFVSPYMRGRVKTEVDGAR